MIRVTPTISIDEREIQEDFVRASGPGGQNVNKVSTAVQLRFDMRNSPSLSDEVKQRLAVLAGRRLTSDGVIILDARQHRSQERNRADALARLVDLIRQAAHRPRRRVATRPTRASKERRLTAKTQRADTKKARGPVRDDH